MAKYECQVDQMECIGCEKLIEDEIDNVDGVGQINADHQIGVVEFTTVDSETGSFVEHLISNLGYEVSGVTVE